MRVITETRVRVPGITTARIREFFLNPTDDAYRRWWPGTHLAFHVVSPRPDHRGEVVWMDEYVGRRRLRMRCVVRTVEEAKIVWRMKMLVTLPLSLTLALEDEPDGVTVVHTLGIEARGLGRLLVPFVRLFFSPAFRQAMDEHARTEFPMMGNILGTRCGSDNEHV